MKGMLWVGEMGAEESGRWYISYVPPTCVWEGKGYTLISIKHLLHLVLQLQRPII